MKRFKRLLNFLLPAMLVERSKRVREVLKLKAYYRELKVHRSQGMQIIHLLHIGKTGGTALKESLRPTCDTVDYRIELHEHNFKLRDVPAGDKVVFFLRDPIRRFVSGFNSRKREGRPHYYSPWSIGEEIGFRQFHTPNELARALSSKNSRIQRAAVTAMKSIAHVKSSYWYWFDNETYFLSRLPDIMFIGFQESLDEDFEILKKKLGLPETISLPKDDIRAHRNPRDLDICIEEEALVNLKEWYAADYEFIRLCNTVLRTNLTEDF
jgi:hypothetical protein